MAINCIEEAGDSLRITVTSGWWLWATTRTFEGSGTVWRDVDTGHRGCTSTEAHLAAIAWKYRRWPELYRMQDKYA